MHTIKSILSIIVLTVILSCSKEASFERIEAGAHILVNSKRWAPPTYSISNTAFSASDDRTFNPIDSTWREGQKLEVYFLSSDALKDGKPVTIDDLGGRFIPEGKSHQVENHYVLVQGRFEIWDINNDAVTGRFTTIFKRDKDDARLDIGGNFKIPR